MADKSTAKRAHDGSGDAPDGQRPAKRIVITDFDNLVTVLVGTEEKRFMLHQDAVCAKSKFFKAACSKKWREGQEKLVRLPEVKLGTFEAYCGWVYSGSTVELTCTPESADLDIIDEHSRLVDLYILGDTLNDLELRNRIVLVLTRSMSNPNSILGSDQCEKVYKSTLPGSQIRKMIVDAIVSRLDRKAFDERIASYPQELILEIAKAATKLAPHESWDKVKERAKQNQETEEAE